MADLLVRAGLPFFLSGRGGEVPDGSVALAAGAVDGPHPVDGLADAAAGPVEGRRAHVPGLLLPLAVCVYRRKMKGISLLLLCTAGD